MRAASSPRLFLPLLVGLIAAAWGCLVLWERGPYARYLHGVNWADVSPLANLCAAYPGAEGLLAGLLYVAAWVLMVAAMMLPTIVPLLAGFQRLTTTHDNRTALQGAVVAGYLLAWLLFGVAVYAADFAFHAAALRSGWLALHGWSVGAAVLAAAGLYQFSRLKYACLDRCRSPLSFIMGGWHGRTPFRDSLYLGLHHGLFCIGCCWSLMMVMFVIGAGSMGWMLALAAIMAVEKNFTWGRHLAKPLGFALIVCAVGIWVANESAWLIG